MKLFSYDEPLGLPKGSVRALLTLATFAAGVTMMMLGKEIPDVFAALWATVAAFYFGTRSAEEKNGTHANT